MPNPIGQRSEVRGSSSQWAGGNGFIHFRAPQEKETCFDNQLCWAFPETVAGRKLKWAKQSIFCNNSMMQWFRKIKDAFAWHLGTDWFQILTVPPTPDPSGQTNMDLRGIMTTPGVSPETSIPSSIPTCFCLCGLQIPCSVLRLPESALNSHLSWLILQLRTL